MNIWRESWFQFWLLVYFNLLDYWLTRPAVLLLGPTAEGNPFLSKAIQIYGVTSILWAKLLALSILAVLLFLGLPRDASATSSNFRRKVAKYLSFANFWYALVVAYGMYLHFAANL